MADGVSYRLVWRGGVLCGPDGLDSLWFGLIFLMTSIVIPLATGSTASRWNNTELRFCLRSIEKHLKGYGEIFVIGEGLPWLRNVTVIPATDHEQTYYKERNIFNKVMLACLDSRVSEDFLFMNDDHFLLQEFEAGQFPYYYYGTLSHQLTRTSPYRQTVANTLGPIKEVCAGELYFDVHSPILYSKQAFERLSNYNWDIKYGFCIKTMYMNLAMRSWGRMVEYCEDLKLSGAMSATQIKQAIAGRPFFSTADNVRDGSMGAVLEELYPSPSKYER